MFYTEAKEILDNCCIKRTGKKASTGKLQPKPRPASQASKPDWWQRGGDAKETTSRTEAYLEAYKMIAKSSVIPTGGIKLQDGYMWIDKGVVRFAISKELIHFDRNEQNFILT